MSKTKVPFQLVDISTEQFATFKENHNQDDYDFDIDLSVSIRIDKEQKVVGVYSKYQFDQNSTPVVVIECACHFKLDKEYWDGQISENILTLDKGLLTHLLVLTVGTSRGVLHEKKPKWLDSLLLPTLNVTGSIEGDISFDLSIEDEEE